MRLAAAQELANRLWGKPRQSVEVSTTKENLADLLNEQDQAEAEAAAMAEGR